jgi:hypothetical protein
MLPVARAPSATLGPSVGPMSRTAVVSVLVFACLALSACGSKTVTDTGANGQATTRTVANVHFPNTKFVLHAGLAFGAFHRYIYKPYRQGGFSAGAPKRKRAIAKAAASGLFAYHELKKADQAAESSDTLRRHVHDPLAALLSNVSSLPALLRAGSFGGLATTSSLFDHLKSSAGGAGANIQDR